MQDELEIYYESIEQNTAICEQKIADIQAGIARLKQSCQTIRELAMEIIGPEAFNAIESEMKGHDS